jgi:hypothetical protein
MDYELLQRHGLTNIEYEPIETGPMLPPSWHSAIGDVGDAGIYNFHAMPKIFTLRFELDGAELDRLEHALRLLEEEEIKAVDGQGPYGIDCWDVACDEDVHEVGDCEIGEKEKACDGEWDDSDDICWEAVGRLSYGGPTVGCSVEAVDKEPMPAHYKYILKYR